MGGSLGKTVGRAGLAGVTGGLSEFGQSNPFGVPGNPAHAPIDSAARSLGFNLFGDPLGNTNQYVPGPFGLDPNQFANDRAAINDQGTQQYNDTLAAIDKNSAAQQQFAGQTLSEMTPGIEEGLNAQHLLNSSALPQELGRQASYLSNQVASQNAQQKLAALQGLQGFQTGALQRGLSLEDFVNQANVAKTIGAQMAPPPPSGKSQFGTVASGVGALAPWAKVASGAGKGGVAAAAGSTAVPALAEDAMFLA